LELKLTESEIHEMLAKLDVQKDGLIQWENFIQITTEVLLGMMMVRKTEIKFSNAQEEYLFLSDLMLFNDPMHEFISNFTRMCKENDTYGDKILPMKKILEIIDKVEEEKKEEEGEEYEEKFLYPKEPEQIEAEFRRRFPGEQKYPYIQMFFILDHLRKSVLVKGMQQAHRGKFETFLMHKFKHYDTKSLGYILLEVMEQALSSIKQIKLTKLQRWIIRSSAPVTIHPDAPEHSMFNYMENSNLIANLLKKLFSPVFQAKKVRPPVFAYRFRSSTWRRRSFPRRI
jgi:hypothetical protein